jgi:hypothetical protein
LKKLDFRNPNHCIVGNLLDADTFRFVIVAPLVPVMLMVGNAVAVGDAASSNAWMLKSFSVKLTVELSIKG